MVLSAGEYVRHYILHTNGIESVWALFKRQIIGTRHFLSPKHLYAYLGEMTSRFNLRSIGEATRKRFVGADRRTPHL